MVKQYSLLLKSHKYQRKGTVLKSLHWNFVLYLDEIWQEIENKKELYKLQRNLEVKIWQIFKKFPASKVKLSSRSLNFSSSTIRTLCNGKIVRKILHKSNSQDSLWHLSNKVIRRRSLSCVPWLNRCNRKIEDFRELIRHSLLTDEYLQLFVCTTLRKSALKFAFWKLLWRVEDVLFLILFTLVLRDILLPQCVSSSSFLRWKWSCPFPILHSKSTLTAEVYPFILYPRE